MNNTHTDSTMNYSSDYIASFLITAWIWGLIAFMVTWGNHGAPAPAPAPAKRVACSDWALHGTVIRTDGETTQLYERTYPSGKKAWRYLDEGDQWAYPRRRELEQAA